MRHNLKSIIFLELDYDTMKAQLRDLFVFYDKEQRGFIPAADFKGILKELDPELPEAELDEIVKEIDADESGTIEFDGDFKEIITWALKTLKKSIIIFYRIH